MAVTLTIAGQTYAYPTIGETNWGSEATDWAIAVSTELLQRTGGTFTLTNDVNFGANFATVQTYLKSRTANIASAGFIRMANADVIAFRNAANSGNNLFGCNSSNEPTWNGVPLLLTPGGVLAVADGGTGLSSYTAGDLIYASATTTLAKLGIGTANYVLVSNGSIPGYALLVNANIDAAAAIARSKLGLGTADHVVINSGTGAFSSEAQLATSRGGTGVNSTATFPTSGTIVTRTATETLTNKTLTTPVINYAVATLTSASSPYSATSADSVILANAASGAITVNLPAAASNTGLVLNIKKTDSSTNLVTVDGNSTETIDGQATFVLGFQYEEITIACDGSNWSLVGYVPVAGTYTPTITGVTNVQASTPRLCHFIKNQNQVTVTGVVEIDPTSGGVNTEFRVTLPIASNLANQYDLSGLGQNTDGGTRFVVRGDSTNDQAFVALTPGGTGNESCYFTFMYTVI